MRMTAARIALPLALAALAATPAGAAEARAIWIEAETPAECNFKHFETSTMGKEALLSGGKWLMKGISGDELTKLVPAEGVRLKYKVVAAQAGTYDLWGRLGWYRARADFEWRVGGAPWTKAPRDMPTINLMELGFFCEVSWTRLGRVELPAGATTLELRYPRAAGEGARMLIALDCFAFVQGRFTPDGPLKPGRTYDGEADRRAARQVYRLPPAKGAARVEVALSGPWQVARHDDPDPDVDTYVPLRTLPDPARHELRWMAFDVPGNPWTCPPLVFGQRLIYRTRVDVPASHEGRGFTLHFSGTHWIVSVFVNGRLAGTHRGVWVPWDLDVSSFIRPGRTNEIAVAVKGTYYALDAKSMGKGATLKSLWNRPLDRKKWTRWVAPIYPSTKGDGDGYVYGIVNPVTLVSVGRAYTEDVFVKPSVEKKRLEAEVTVRNAGRTQRRLSVRCEAVCDRDGKVDKSFGPVELSVPAGKARTVTVVGEWAEAKLWWPVPDPDLYRLRTTISEAGKVVDVHEELFGFREVTVRGTGIYINGVRRNVWNWVDVHKRRIAGGEEWADCWRRDGSRFMRFSHGRRITPVLKSREQRLEFYDRSGIPGRLCTMIDGMFISYNLGLRTREKDKDGKPLLRPNEPVWENFREHMAQVARAYRNHPSVIFYQVENELVYINGMNIYGAYLDKVEELMNGVVEAGRKHDPTRPYTVGGGGDLSGRLEINCPHYPHTALDYYPDNAYTLKHYATKIQRWPWRRDKPWVVGESLFANELRLGACAAGDEVYRGTHDARKGKAKFLRAVYGGYRWAGVAGFFPWDNLWQFDDSQKMFSALCVIPRKQTHRLFAGRENPLLVKVMNDTLRREPVTFEWACEIGGRTVASSKQALRIEPGFGEEQTIVIPAPRTDKRLDGKLILRARQDGAEAYVDERPIAVLPTGRALKATAAVHVLDRKGALAAFLRKRGTTFARVDSLRDVKGKRGVLLIGPGSLTPEEAFGPALLGFAVAGGRVICLEQEHPLSGAALPAPIRPSTRFGGYAHPQALGTAIFRDLGRDDLIDWAGDHPTYTNAYYKPTRGGRSLAECGGSLDLSPLIEVPCGQGVILLCQLRVGASLGIDPAADVLLRNFLSVYAEYRPASGVAAVVAPDGALLVDKVRASGVRTARVASVAGALDRAKYRVAVVHAGEKNLKALLAAKADAEAFQDAGGWIVLCGVAPAGIDELNALVGASHMLRPFRIERVTLESPHHPLAATLGNRDVALYSPRPLLHGRYWVSGHTFSHVIDGRDFAPFTRPPGAPEDPYEYKPTGDDHDPFNFVNGMLRSDFWRYIQQIWIPEEGPQPLVFRLRRGDVLDTIRIWNNTSYWTIKDLDVILDGDEKRPVRLVLPDSDDMTVVKLPRPRKVLKTITLRIRTWRENPTPKPGQRLVGIDNVQFLRPAAPKGGVFLDSVGGLVAFPRGAGGVLLNQLKFLPDEPRKSNDGVKVRILGVLLQNMGVGFRSAAAVAVPGVNVRFRPINLQEHGTGYLDDRSGKAGWFGRKDEDLRHLPRGRQVLADVEYHVVDYATAPTPDVVMLGEPRSRVTMARTLPGKVAIPVGRQADVLYFLHTANITRPITERERDRMTARRNPFQLPEVAKYVLHYADGKTREVPVVLERHVGHWLQESPKPLSGARLAWSQAIQVRVGRQEQKEMRAVLYSMQVANPRPEVRIERIDFVLGKDGPRAVPALLAVTTGEIVATKR